MADPEDSIMTKMMRAAAAVAFEPALDLMIKSCPSVDATIMIEGLIEAATLRLHELRGKVPAPIVSDPIPKTLN